MVEQAARSLAAGGGMPVDVLGRALWCMKWRLVLAMLLLFGLGAATVLLWPRAYLAQAVVAPAETTGLATSTLISPSVLSSPGGLLDNRPSGNFAIYLAALRGPEAVAMLAQDTPLLTFLSGQRDSGAGGWLRRLLEIDGPADLDDARRWLEKRLSVTQSLTSITWVLELTHPDREMAQEMLARLHAFAEAKVRADLLDLTRRRIAALQQRLETERDQYLRNPLFELLAQHQRAYVAVMSDESTAARMVSPPMVELKPSVPNRPLLLALLLVAVPMAVMLGATCLALLRGEKRARQGMHAIGGENWAAGAADLATAAGAPRRRIQGAEE